MYFRINCVEDAYQIRRIFGFLFICVSLAVAISSVTSEILFLNNLPNYLHGVVWIITFGIIFGVYFLHFKEKLSLIRNRMKNSLAWPLHIKILNGICWAFPFALIGVFPQHFQYLILLGIGLGNTSTYIFMRFFSNQNNKEQILVGLTALLVIPLAVLIDTTLFESNQDIAILLSRILISISYLIGGLYAVFLKIKIS
ncbi:MAG: hypothetical protein HC944_02935 [Nanoarchaeota archaeon]|nr:hypothetical protein [Nanoarchaeota archaeon]